MLSVAFIFNENLYFSKITKEKEGEMEILERGMNEKLFELLKKREAEVKSKEINPWFEPLKK